MQYCELIDLNLSAVCFWKHVIIGFSKDSYIRTFLSARSPKEQLAIVKQMAAHAPLDSQYVDFAWLCKY